MSSGRRPDEYGHPGRGAYQRLGYDISRLCSNCESGFHPRDECPVSETPERMRYTAADFARIRNHGLDEDELEPPPRSRRNHHQRRENRRQGDNEHRDVTQRRRENREARQRRRQNDEWHRENHRREQEVLRELEQRHLENEVERAMNSRIGDREYGISRVDHPPSSPPPSYERRRRRPSASAIDQEHNVFEDDFDRADEVGDYDRAWYNNSGHFREHHDDRYRDD